MTEYVECSFDGLRVHRPAALDGVLGCAATRADGATLPVEPAVPGEGGPPGACRLPRVGVTSGQRVPRQRLLRSRAQQGEVPRDRSAQQRLPTGDEYLYLPDAAGAIEHALAALAERAPDEHRTMVERGRPSRPMAVRWSSHPRANCRLMWMCLGSRTRTLGGELGRLMAREVGRDWRTAVVLAECRSARA